MRAAALAGCTLLGGTARAADAPIAHVTPGDVSPAAAVHPDAAVARRLVRLPSGAPSAKALRLDVWATEPLLANPVGFALDERGRVFVAETFRYRDGGTWDNRHRAIWAGEEFRKKASPERLRHLPDELLDRELALRTVADRAALIREYMDVPAMSRYSERVRLVEDRDGDGRAETSTVFAEGFNDITDGLAASVLPRRGDVFFTDIPNLWRLRDRDGDGRADDREILSTGYGVRYAFTGHDLHGLRLGPDGRLYFSIGDRASHVVTAEGKVLASPDTGSVFRCELDGSRLETFATGLRNPQDLVFDERGDLFTGDNNSDGGDKARLVHVVEAGDSGWRIGYQYIEAPVARGPWNAEHMWEPARPDQPAHMLPPITNLASGPSGITYYPGTGLDPDLYAGKFLLADFRGQHTLSGVRSFSLRPRGATFEIVAPEQHLWNLLVTDLEFGPDGALYLLDWVQGWLQSGKGRIWRLSHPAAAKDPRVAETRKLLAEGLGRRREDDLGRLLGHADQRVRVEAQLALVERGAAGTLAAITQAGQGERKELARLHALWGLGHLLRRGAVTAPEAIAAPLVERLSDADAEVRRQAARVLGEAPGAAERPGHAGLVRLLDDPEPRVRLEASLALGRRGERSSVEPVLASVRRFGAKEPLLRHGAVTALSGAADEAALARLSTDASAEVRLVALLALRRKGSAEVARFLADREPQLVREAARAINDTPIDAAAAALASLATRAAKTPSSVTDEPVLLRAANAAFRMGSMTAAQALAGIAGARTHTAPVREEALLALGAWARPGIRDRVTGNFHPVGDAGHGGSVPTVRDAGPAKQALTRVLPSLLASGTAERVRLAALQAARSLDLRSAMSGVERLLAERSPAGARTRRAVLELLAAWKAPQLGRAVARAAADPDPAVRTRALGLEIGLFPARAGALLGKALRSGSDLEKKAALDAVTKIEAADIDAALLAGVDALAAGTFPPAAELELIEAAAARKEPTIKARVQSLLAARREAAEQPGRELDSYREALVGGDPEQGSQIFFKNQQVQCLRCHKINGEGADVGPDLSTVARDRDARFLLESVARPSAHFAPGFEAVILTMKDGGIKGGVVKQETATHLDLLTPDLETDRAEKARIARREAGASGMPEGFADILSRRELRDLVAYLVTLK